MNIALERTKEFVDGKLRRNYGDAFVRGNNGELQYHMAEINGTDFTGYDSDVHFCRLVSGVRGEALYSCYEGSCGWEKRL